MYYLEGDGSGMCRHWHRHRHESLLRILSIKARVPLMLHRPLGHAGDGILSVVLSSRLLVGGGVLRSPLHTEDMCLQGSSNYYEKRCKGLADRKNQELVPEGRNQDTAGRTVAEVQMECGRQGGCCGCNHQGNW